MKESALLSAVLLAGSRDATDAPDEAQNRLTLMVIVTYFAANAPPLPRRDLGVKSLSNIHSFIRRRRSIVTRLAPAFSRAPVSETPVSAKNSVSLFMLRQGA